MATTTSKVKQDKVMNINYIYKGIASFLLLTAMTINSYANTETISSISFGDLSKNLTSDTRITIAKENKLASIVDQQLGKATNKTRVEMRSSQNKALLKEIAKNKSHDNTADFSIYGASSFLQHDIDSDGFYQTFSVSFDADIYSYIPSQFANVYALLYISKNGGPWTHYYTTDNFLIEGDTDADEYEVITTFLSGYATDHYDILIDLYQDGYSDIVASFSSNDSNALFALPLESADYDEPYIEVVEVSHGGSFSGIVVLLLMLTYSLRYRKAKQKI